MARQVRPSDTPFAQHQLVHAASLSRLGFLKFQAMNAASESVALTAIGNAGEQSLMTSRLRS